MFAAKATQPDLFHTPYSVMTTQHCIMSRYGMLHRKVCEVLAMYSRLFV